MQPAADGEVSQPKSAVEAADGALAKQRERAQTLTKAPVIVAMSGHMDGKLTDTPTVFR